MGDSVMDTGNNNYIKTWVKSDYPPYGQNFDPDHNPTGRFSNGKLIPDMLASFLGIKETVPPYLNPANSPEELVTGVNFASAGSGFDDATTLLSNVISVTEQMEYFKEYIGKLKVIVGEKKAMEIISDGLMILSAGTNDWIFNFYDVPTRRLQYNVTGYQTFLLHKIQKYTEELYELGCRNIMVSGLAPTGCLPVQLTLKKSPGKCLDDENKDSQQYNQRVVELVAQMQTSLPGSKIVYNDIFTTILDMIVNPTKYGFEETKKGCCGNGITKLSFFCDKKTPPCKDPTKYMFWDMIHPTETAYKNQVNFMIQNVLPKFL